MNANIKTALALTLFTLVAGVAPAATIQGTAACDDDCDGVVVFLEGVPAAAAGDDATAELDQVDRTFVPKVLAIAAGTTVRIKNSDPFLHNVHIFRDKKTVFNFALPFKGQTLDQTFTEPGVYQVRCDAHPEMSATIVVLDTPYFAVPEADGSFTIDAVPAGSYTLVTLDVERGKRVEKPLTVEDGAVAASF